MYYFVYKTTNQVNGKIYVGIHKTDDLDDGYLGSGIYLKRAIKKHGRQNFSREILHFGESYEDVMRMERDIVTPEFCSRRDTYNSDVGGSGGKVWTPELRAKMSASVKAGYSAGRKNWNAGKKIGDILTPEGRARRRVQVSGNGNPMFGKSVTEFMTPEAVERWRSNIAAGNRKPKSKREGYSTYAKKRRWIVNREGKLGHVTDINDPRIQSGDWILGKKWKEK